jgi:[acyl-carrier-protein] S-malonyltransferase
MADSGGSVAEASDGLVFLFPGQGSQREGMLGDAARAFPEVGECFAIASDALGYDLWRVICDNEGDRLNLTEYTQPALLTASVALWTAWRHRGGAVPAAMAGHSLGELSAFCCAGSIDLADAVRIVRERGRAMQTAVPIGEGSMAAVLGLDDATVVGVCAELSTRDAVVEAVNFNAPGQVVIAGHARVVEEAVEALRAAGAKRALPLSVSAPFHTTLMAPAADRLAEVLDDIDLRAPTIPVIHNVHASVEHDVASIRSALVRQVAAPVRWTDCVATLIAMGATRACECGPGKVLGGLLRRIDRSIPCFYLEAPEDFDAALAA